MPSSNDATPSHPARARKRVLVVSAPGEEAQRFLAALEGAGYMAYERPDAQSALAAVLEAPPDMIVVDYEAPPRGGQAFCRDLKRDSLFAHLPVLLLAPPDLFVPGFEWASCPVEEFVPKPPDLRAALTRIELCFARASRQLDANPLTRLPGNNSIIAEIERRIAGQEPFAAAYADIDNFKAFNDKYGFSRGDEALRLTARVLVNAVDSARQGAAFVGHIGGDDFVFLVHANEIDRICQLVIANFDLVIHAMYDEEDRVRGFIDTVNRKGERERFPMMSISVAAVANTGKRINHYGQISSIVAELKKFLKKTPTSNYLVDRRADIPGADSQPDRRRPS